MGTYASESNIIQLFVLVANEIGYDKKPYSVEFLLFSYSELRRVIEDALHLLCYFYQYTGIPRCLVSDCLQHFH